jgi:hypothetical protein
MTLNLPTHDAEMTRDRQTDRNSPSEQLGRYLDSTGRAREIVCRTGASRCLVVIDRADAAPRDARLVAALGSDEPSGNAALIARLYLDDVHASGAHFVLPRPLTDADFEQTPFATAIPDLAHDHGAGRPDAPTLVDDLVDAWGSSHRVECVRANGMSIPELRWVRRPGAPGLGPSQVVSLRDVIGRMQDYEPARSITASLATDHHPDPRVSVVVLRAELARVAVSCIVLNRGLREAAVAVTIRDGLSMSQVAMRCGRVKRDARGNVSGETSWLARRVGLLPEGGELTPTPWIHSDVLALIARRGLGVCPRDVELG